MEPWILHSYSVNYCSNIWTHHGIIYIHMEESGSLAITAVQVEDLVAMGFDGEIAREAVEDLHYGPRMH